MRVWASEPGLLGKSWLTALAVGVGVGVGAGAGAFMCSCLGALGLAQSSACSPALSHQGGSRFRPSMGA